MKSLLSASLCLLLACCSCAPSITRECRKGETVSATKGQFPPMIDASSRLCKYNMTIDFMRKHFSGLLLVKETETGTYRTLFSTHFGLSLFDLEIGSDSLTVHHCIEPLNKKKILSLFYRDFSVLFGLNIPPENKVTVYNCTDPQTDIVYKLSTPGFKGYYRIDGVENRMREIKLGSGLRKTTFRSFPDSSGQEAIRIRHTGLKLSIGLDAFH